MQIKLTFHNIEDVSIGDYVFFDGMFGRVESDALYEGALRVGGSSVKYLIENYKECFLQKRS